MNQLSQLQPMKVFEYFECICRIPHGSYNCKAVSDFCVEFAKDRGLEVSQDDAYNVIIKKPASPDYKGEATLILQGHLDMVCQKTKNSNFDFTKDALDLQIDGDFLFAKDTSLGGDDGIAVAYALAILDDDTLTHPNLEVVFTTEEEVGMLGAAALDPTPLKGRYLLNIDSEEEGVLITSCAGGSIAKVTLPIQREVKSGQAYEVMIHGLVGGHSGTEIDKGHGNAHKMLGEVLAILLAHDVSIYHVGGNDQQKDNAIPTQGQVQFLVEDIASIEEKIKELEAKFVKEYEGVESDIQVTIQKLDDKSNISCLIKESSQRIQRFLSEVVNGIYTMSSDIEGLVESSLNLGVIELSDEAFVATFGVRSSVEDLKDTLFEEIKKTTDVCDATLERISDYPGWEYRKDSLLRERFREAYRELYHDEVKVEAIHAGLECGILGSKIPDLDMIAFGPDILDIHTTKERLSISSTKRVWELLLKIIEEFP